MRLHLQDQLRLWKFALKWAVVSIPIGLLVGAACALFLWSLDRATETRWQHPWLLYLLPLGGAAVGWLYWRLGQSVEAGNNLIMDEIHEPGGGVPLRMAPLILIGTVVTHLFGGSAGREGTAVQMGGALASGVGRRLGFLQPSDYRILLTTGIAAGFGGVFGTPVAGTVFALEVLTIGRVSYAAILPCLMAAIAADWSCTAWGIAHTHYHLASILPPDSFRNVAPLDPQLLTKVAIAAFLFGWTSWLFSELTHELHAFWKRRVPWPIARPVCGGLTVIALAWLLGTQDYLGLGVSSPNPQSVTILSSFHPGGATTCSWLWKLVFTAVTVSSGFKGGEVTPLFFIGAALGNTLAGVFGGPTDLFAAAGFVAVFAGATNTPIACTIMAIELFGGEYSLYFATACIVAYFSSGQTGIYLSQRVGAAGVDVLHPPGDTALRTARRRTSPAATAPVPPPSPVPAPPKSDFSQS